MSGMRVITKREQTITYMQKNSIDLLCLQETKTPSSSVEQRDKHIFVFSTSETGGTDRHGVGFCYNRRIGKYRNHYIQHSSHLAEMGINMHGNPLVILTAYMPRDASAEINRVATWEDMSNKIRGISHNKNVVVLGDFNAAVHARKEGEEERLGLHVWGKGIAFLREKEGLLPESMDRNILIELLKEHDMMRCMSTYFEKPNSKKATYRHMWATGMQGPRDTDRYSELDLRLAFGRWANSIKNVEPDSFTNVNTDHLALGININQKLKALAEAEHGKEFSGAKSENEQQTIPYDEMIRESIMEGKTEDMESIMRTLAKAAEETLTLKPPRVRKRDCHPELERLVACREIAVEQDDEDEVKRIIRLFKKRARKVRTE